MMTTNLAAATRAAVMQARAEAGEHGAASFALTTLPQQMQLPLLQLQPLWLLPRH